MYIGLGIVLLVIGAIFSFDVVTLDLNNVNEQGLGVILMIGGVAAILLSLGLQDRYRRRGTVVEDRRGTVVEEEPVVRRRVQ